MPQRQSTPIELTLQHRRLLGKWHKGTLSTGFSRRVIIRVDIVMRAAAGQPNYQIAKQLKISRNTVKLWRYRFAREGVAGLMTRPIPGRPRKAAKQIRTAETESLQQAGALGSGLPFSQPEVAPS